MSLLCTTFSLIIGLYFLRNNIILSIIISIAYFVFLFIRFGKRKTFLLLGVFILGVVTPVVPLPQNDAVYGGIVVEARDNYILLSSKFHKYYVSSLENDYEVGDYLRIEGYAVEIKRTTYESQFDFAEYLQNKGAYEEIKATLIDKRFTSPVKLKPIKSAFLSHFDENTSSLISAFLFNDKDYSSDVIKLADKNGLLYMYSLSGMYLQTLFVISNYLLLLKFSKKKSRILTFIIFLPLAFFSFSKIGTLRVYALYFLKYLNEFHFKKKLNHIELVSLLALIFIAIDYHLAYQEAFYIGFLLSGFAPVLLNSISYLPKRKRKLISTLLFIIPLFPLKISGGNYNLLTSFLGKIMFIPNLLFLLMVVFAFLFPVYDVINWLGGAEFWILEKMDLINIRIPFGNWGGAFSFIFIGVFILLVYLLESVRLRHANYAVLVMLLCSTISMVPLQEPLTNAVYFVNVGQGDCIILKNKTNTIMIDTGGTNSFDMAEETLIPFMNKKKITHIDALILTHDDLDHSGAKDSLMTNFKVNNVLTEKDQFPYTVGDITLENLNTFDFDSDNDNSLVLTTYFINKRFIFTGDASTKVEKAIISKYNVDCDVLKVGHHGSKYSTCEEFLKACSPSEAIISVGAKNFYGHPNDEVIDLLNKYDVKIRRTDEEGTICYLSLTT